MASKLLCCLLPIGLAGCDTLCFVAGTLIETPRGRKAIDMLEVGDVVWSFSLERGERVARPVRATLRNKAREVRRIRAGGRVIAGVTAEHPFFDLAKREYRPVRELAMGDVLAALDGERVRPCPIESVTSSETPDPRFEVYNLTIDGPEANYFAEGILVHNKPPEDPPCPEGLVTVTEHRSDPDAATGAVTWGDYDVAFGATPEIDSGIIVACYAQRGKDLFDLDVRYTVEKVTERLYRARVNSPLSLRPAPGMEILCNVNVETHLDYKVEGVSCATFGDHVFLIPHWGSDGGAGEVSDAGIDGDEMPPDGSTDAASETRR